MSAVEILGKAVQCDKSGRYMEALTYYLDGTNILLQVIANEANPDKKKTFQMRIKEYIERAEEIQKRINLQSTKGESVENILIAEGSTGHSYNSLFGKYLDESVQEILIDEPHLHRTFQFQNLVIFLELVVKKCFSLKFIRLQTKTDTNAANNQINLLQDIKEDLIKRNIRLYITFDEKLHDRKIVLSNGYIIKIGRGLHFFKAPNPKYTLGLIDYDFRECLQTNVDIWRTKI